MISFAKQWMSRCSSCQDKRQPAFERGFCHARCGMGLLTGVGWQKLHQTWETRRTP